MSRETGSNSSFGTLLTAMVTPFNQDGSIDFHSVAKLANHLVESGHDGIVVNGTTGESPVTHRPEKQELLEAVKEAVAGRAKVIAGVGSNDTEHTLSMVAAANEVAVDGLLVVTPYYSRASQAGLAKHIETVAASSDLPIMLYDVPSRVGTKYELSTLVQLSEIPTVVAYKDATGVVSAVQRGIEATGLDWYCGDDGLYLTYLALGAAGVVSVVGHVAGKQLVAVADAVAAGDLAAARKIFLALDPAINAVNGRGFQAVATKAALTELGIINSNHVRLPNVPADAELIAEVLELLAEAGIGK